jgi:hypothetical protein
MWGYKSHFNTIIICQIFSASECVVFSLHTILNPMGPAHEERWVWAQKVRQVLHHSLVSSYAQLDKSSFVSVMSVSHIWSGSEPDTWRISIFNL